jgi:hypothetical protein
MKENKWIRLLAYVTGLVNQELLLQNEYLAAENRVLRAHLPARLRLSDSERSILAEIGKRLGRRALAQVAPVARPDTILAWFRKLITHKFDGSKYRRYPGRPRIEPKRETLIVLMAKENSGWGYDRIVGALANLGYKLRSDGRECSETPRDCASAEAEASHCASPRPKHDLEGIYSIAYGGVGRHRFLHGRSAHLAWVGDILRLVLHSPGESACQLGRIHPASRPGLDVADGAQRDRGDLGIPAAAAIRIARSRHQVLLGVSGDARGWWYKTDSTPGAEFKSEYLRREMGAIGKE